MSEFRELPPWPVNVTVLATMRDDHPVAMITFFDGMAVQQAIHLSPNASMALARDLLAFVHQIGIRS